LGINGKYFNYLVLGNLFVDPGNRAGKHSSAAFRFLGLRVLNPMRIRIFVPCVCFVMY